MSKGPKNVRLPADAVTDARLAARDLRVLALLVMKARSRHWVKASQVVMARELSTSRGSVQTSLNRLIRAGYVERRNKIRTATRRSHVPFEAHVYILTWMGGAE